MKYIFTVILIACSSNLFAQSLKKIDTIYVLCHQENLINKFYTIDSTTNNLSIGFFFKVDWEIHNSKKDMFFVYYLSPKGKVNWVHNSIELIKLNSYKIYSLHQFTKALKNNDFSVPIANEKIQIMMLYGERCSTKFELYPVKVGTNLTNEG